MTFVDLLSRLISFPNNGLESLPSCPNDRDSLLFAYSTGNINGVEGRKVRCYDPLPRIERVTRLLCLKPQVPSTSLTLHTTSNDLFVRYVYFCKGFRRTLGETRNGLIVLV